MAYKGGAKDLGEAGKRHFVGFTLSSNSLQVEDDKRQRVLVGGGELCDGLQGSPKAFLVILTLCKQRSKFNNHLY